MGLTTYQALLSNPESVARIQAGRREVERVGGKLAIAPPNKVGMVVIVLQLPEGYWPDVFFPGMPFYPV